MGLTDGAMDSSVNPMLEDLCAVVSETLRPLVLSVQSLDTLCELVHILSTEVVEETLRPRGASVAAMATVITRLLHDVQERLIYRTQCYIQSDVQAFEPAAADLDYPALLDQHYAAVRQHRAASSAAADGGAAPAGVEPGRYDTWYPTLQRTLMCLSKIYRCVESSIFESLGQDAVAACTASFVAAAKAIETRQSPLDGDLFIIKHLLILREQIAPFDIAFTSTEKFLDFSTTQEALTQLLSRTTSVFTLSVSNPLLTFMVRGIPAVREDKVDSKKDLEVELKQACERFIARATQQVAQPLLELVDAISRFQAAAGGAGDGLDDAGGGSVLALRDQPFVSSTAMQTMVDALRQRLQVQLPALRHSLALYLGSPVTHSILFKPVKNNMMTAFTAWRRALQLDFGSAVREEFLPLVNALLALVDRSDRFAVDPNEHATAADAVEADQDPPPDGTGEASSGTGAAVAAPSVQQPVDASTAPSAADVDTAKPMPVEASTAPAASVLPPASSATAAAPPAPPAAEVKTVK